MTSCIDTAAPCREDSCTVHQNAQLVGYTFRNTEPMLQIIQQGRDVVVSARIRRKTSCGINDGLKSSRSYDVVWNNIMLTTAIPEMQYGSNLFVRWHQRCGSRSGEFVMIGSVLGLKVLKS